MSPRPARQRDRRRPSRSDAGTPPRTGGLRCAVYTRKSSEEGLEQDFNSLHAQREACEAYVASQRHEGWRLLPEAYDDGGVSGGTLDRPALTRLLAAVEAGQIDVVVVYKVDRLTRALSDFARIVEVFDGKGVSFVSVTQQFNTTSSMGRLTLNVLLSFAQFEREVTGERIRDKIAASKRKGLWMGGFVPLGYRSNERTLAIEEAEADTVRQLFALYRTHGNVRRVKQEADRLGLVSKRRAEVSGRMSGGVSFTRGALYKLLSNPVYAGDIVHRGTRHPGQHPAIIPPAEFEAVQRGLTSGAARARGQGAPSSPSLLAGLIVDQTGAPLTPTHANKKGRRYRYYVSRALVAGTSIEPNAPTSGSSGSRREGWRLPAAEIEALVVDALYEQLIDQGRLMDRFGLGLLRPDELDRALKAGADLADALKSANAEEQRALLENLVARIEIAAEHVVLIVRRQALWDELGAVDPKPDPDNELFTVEITVPIRLARRGAELKLVLGDRHHPRRDRGLIGRLAQGFLWFEELRTGAVSSLGEIAEREGIATVMVRRACDLAFLSTDAIEAILAGDQPVELTSEALKVAYPLPVAWEEQRRVLGFA